MISIRPRGFKSSRGAPRGEDSREGLPRCPCILTQKKQPADLREQARTLNLDQERFDKCLVEGVEAAAVEKDAEEAKSSGITGTPSFLSIVITSVGCLPMLRCRTWSSSN